MPNPYDPTESVAFDRTKLRSVRGLIVWSALIAFSAYPLLSSAFRLLNQELGIFPVRYGTYDIEVNGIAVSNGAFIVSSLMAGLLLLSIAAVLALRARRNYTYNADLVSSQVTQSGK